jgi:lipid-binding SYLF domain-containing protein
MKKRSSFGAELAMSALLATTSAAVASEQTDTLAQATLTAQHMKSDPAFGPARNMLNQARGLLIIPRLVKGGFIFGAEGGDGVLVGKTTTGWSDPAFYRMSAASFGLQAGLEKAEIVMLIMNDKALNAVENGDFKLGADAGLTVATLSGGSAAGNLVGDIIVWTSATGAYGGLTLNGSSIKPRYDWNRKFYGRPVGVPDIVAGNVQNPNASQLRATLDTVGSG